MYSEFIINGDFYFPFDWSSYLAKIFYIWSFTNGAINFDGVIRIFIRVPNLLFFYFSNNVFVSYFYIFSVFLFSLFSFFIFAKYFLKEKNRKIILLSSLLFILNPIFLGNTSKIGLVLSVSALPLMLTAIKLFFEKKNFKYLLAFILVTNISIIHPFTLAVNIITCFFYILFKVFSYKDFIFGNIKKISTFLILGVLLNLYYIIPILGVGSIDKDILSNEVEQENIEYTGLIKIASTDDILTAFSLSKNRLKDFEFYDESYKNIYFYSILLIYTIILIGYLRYSSSFNKSDKKIFFLNLSLFLLLLLFSTGYFLYIDEFHKFIISLPGGWSFRSPLKWQLYIPFFLASLILLTLRNILSRNLKKLFSILILISILFGNFFISVDIYKKLIIPKKVKVSDFFDAQIVNSNFLFINEKKCGSSLSKNVELNYSLNQILLSEEIQVKRVNVEKMSSLNLKGYDFIFTCENTDRFQGFETYRNFYSGEVKILKNINSLGYATIYDEKLFTSRMGKNDLIHIDFDSTKQTDYADIDPTKKKITINKISDKVFLNIKDSFNSGWNIRIGNFSWVESLFVKDYFLPKEFHFQNDANLNTFKIDPEFIKKNYPNSYKENPDGSIDVELTLFFKPQAYFYLGLIISGTTLLGCIGYLVWVGRKSIRNFFRKIVNFVGRRKGKKKIKTGSEKR